MVYNIDPITNACYRSGEEIFYTSYAYVQTIDPKVIIDNTIYNFGDIFDAIRDTYLYFINDDRGVINLPYDAGLGIGTAIYLVFKPAQ